MRITVSVLLITSIPIGVAYGTDTDEHTGINGTVEYGIEQENVTATVQIENVKNRTPIHLGSAEIADGLNSYCLESSDGVYSKYHVEPYCNSVEFEVTMSPIKSMQESTGFRTDSNRTDKGFLFRTEQEIGLKNDKGEYEWFPLSEVLETEKTDEILLADEYILGGSAWKSDEVTVGEDIVRVHHIENGENDLESLNQYNVPTDGVSETVNTFIITSEGNDTFGSYGGAYFSGTNSIVLREKMGIGATIHEYAHSQQEYEVSSNMTWIIEGGATYDSTIGEKVVKNPSEEHINKRKSVYRSEVRDSILANSSTWSGPAAYSKGQSIFFLLDTCIEGRTDGDRDSKYLVKYLRTETDRVTLNTLSYSVSHIVSSSNETDDGELGEIKKWLRPYIHQDKNADKEVLIGESYSQCWWNSTDTDSGNTEEVEDGYDDIDKKVIEEIKEIVDF